MTTAIKIHGLIADEDDVNATYLKYAHCNHRKYSAGGAPKDITLIHRKYLPYRTDTTSRLKQGIFWDETIKAGGIYIAYDNGKRLVLEVGCDTVIYLNISPDNKPRHHRIFIQPTKNFFHDFTQRAVAVQVIDKTRFIKPIAMFELYFIMGALSVISTPMMLAMLGTDASMVVSSNAHKVECIKKLASVIIKESNHIETYAPNLHHIYTEIFFGEQIDNAGRGVKKLPETVVTTPKVQAQVSGILFGLIFGLGKEVFTLRVLIVTLLFQAGIKGATNSPNAFIKVTDERYRPLYNEFRDVQGDPAAAQKLLYKLKKMADEADIDTIEEKHFIAAIKEIHQNEDQLIISMQNIDTALASFDRCMNLA